MDDADGEVTTEYSVKELLPLGVNIPASFVEPLTFKYSLSLTLAPTL